MAATRGYEWRYAAAGARRALSLAGLVMALSFAGFGAMLRALHLPLWPGLLSTIFVWALPGQVVMVEAMAAGLPLLLVTAAVTLTAVRLMPMVVLVLARARLPGASAWPAWWAAHYIAATVWIVSDMHLDAVPRPGRLPWVIGLGTALLTGMVAATAVGYLLAGRLPVALAATLVMFTPAFFFIALLDGARHRADWLAIAAGALLGPALRVVWPGFDMLLAGLGGGTLAFLIGRLGQGRGER